MKLEGVRREITKVEFEVSPLEALVEIQKLVFKNRLPSGAQYINDNGGVRHQAGCRVQAHS